MERKWVPNGFGLVSGPDEVCLPSSSFLQSLEDHFKPVFETDGLPFRSVRLAFTHRCERILPYPENDFDGWFRPVGCILAPGSRGFRGFRPFVGQTTTALLAPRSVRMWRVVVLPESRYFRRKRPCLGAVNRMAVQFVKIFGGSHVIGLSHDRHA